MGLRFLCGFSGKWAPSVARHVGAGFGEHLCVRRSSRPRAFEWVRHHFFPEREPPSDRNVILIIPAFVDREQSGKVAVVAHRRSAGEVRFIDQDLGRAVEQ